MELLIPSLSIVLSLLSNTIYSQVVNDSCHTATELVINSFGDFSCVDGTTIGATPDEFPNHPCSISGFPTVWYKVGLEYDATHLNLHVSNEDDFTTVIRVFQEVDGCDVLYPLAIGPDEQTCLSGINGQVKLIGFEINGYSAYYIAVSTLNLNGADFELCVNSTAQEISCVREKEIFFYNMSSQNRPRGPFYPGDEVQVCMTVPVFNSANNGCQWFQGLVPVFGAGWDAGSFEINGQPLNATLNGDYIGAPGNGVYANTTWDWFTDVGYHTSHPFYQIGDLDYNGTEEMCSNLFDPYCPNLGGIFGGCCGPCWDNQGDELPPGWFAYGINGSCNTPGPPVGVDWGDGNTCSGIMGPWEFCFQVQVEKYPYCSLYGNSLDLTLGFYTFSDGEIGAWSGGSSACVYDPPLQLRLPALCFDNVEQVEPIDIVVCGSDTVILPLLEYTDRDHLINYWYYENESISTLNDASYLKPTDTLNFRVFPESNKYITKKYLTVYGHRGEQTVCEVLYFRILIYPEIDATFEFEANGLGIQFNSTIDVDSIYSWSFGDHAISDDENPFHLYQEDGIYQVQLIVSTPCGNDTSSQELDLITSPPLVSFNYNPHRICVGDTIFFSSDIHGYIDSLAWTFEGGLPYQTTMSNAAVTYTTAGVYDVMLTATNHIGSDSLLVADAVIVDSLPVLKYHVEVYDSLLVFTYTGSPVDSVYWDLGNGEIAHGTPATKIYEGPGQYPVVLYAITACGLDSIPFSVTIQITSPPIVSFNYAPHHICAGDTVYFASNIMGHIDSIQWTFDGGLPGQATSDTAAINYQIAGVFDVTLIASNQVGSDTLLIADAVFVDSIPVLTYHVEVYDSLLVFTYTGSPVDSVYWDLGDGVIAYGIAATKIYTGPGQYPVILFVKSVCGMDSIPFTVTIQTTSIRDENSALPFTLFPNPASDQVRLHRLETLEIAEVGVYNSVGQLIVIRHLAVDQDELLIDPNNLGMSPGAYFVVLTTGRGCFMAPLIVQ